jgi:hypothetical protein
VWFWRRTHPASDEELSAYIDGQLAPAARTRLEAHIETCSGCRDALAELRSLQRTLGALPRAQAPRSFALREADVHLHEAASQVGMFSRATPLLSGVAMVAAVVFVVLVGVDLSGPGSSGRGDDASGAGQATSVDLELAAAAPEAADELGGDDALLEDGSFAERGDDGDTVAPEAPQSLPADGSPDLPATSFEPPPSAELAAEGDDRTSLRAAEAATAAVALVAGGSLLLAWWRRRA